MQINVSLESSNKTNEVTLSLSKATPPPTNVYPHLNEGKWPSGRGVEDKYKRV